MSSNPGSPVQAPSSPSETMQIFVKTIKGETIPLSVSSSSSFTVGDLINLLSTEHKLPTNLRLIHSGRHLSDAASPLSAYNVRAESTVSLSLPPQRSSRPNLPKCEFKKGTPDQCRKAREKIVGDCAFCAGHFCSRHRLLESHNCEGLEDCKKESHEKNAQKLEGERTYAIKGI